MRLVSWGFFSTTALLMYVFRKIAIQIGAFCYWIWASSGYCILYYRPLYTWTCFQDVTFANICNCEPNNQMYTWSANVRQISFCRRWIYEAGLRRISSYRLSIGERCYTKPDSSWLRRYRYGKGPSRGSLPRHRVMRRHRGVSRRNQCGNCMSSCQLR